MRNLSPQELSNKIIQDHDTGHLDKLSNNTQAALWRALDDKSRFTLIAHLSEIGKNLQFWDVLDIEDRESFLSRLSDDTRKMVYGKI